jgi:hypothetical protein
MNESRPARVSGYLAAAYYAVIADQYDSMGALHPIFEMNLPCLLAIAVSLNWSDKCRARHRHQIRLAMFRDLVPAHVHTPSSAESLRGSTVF